MVAVEFVFETRLDHMLVADTSMRYPVVAVPPVLVGAVHDRLIVVWPSATAISDVGAPGAVAAAVVAFAMLEATLVPAVLIAKIR